MTHTELETYVLDLEVRFDWMQEVMVHFIEITQAMSAMLVTMQATVDVLNDKVDIVESPDSVLLSRVKYDQLRRDLNEIGIYKSKLSDLIQDLMELAYERGR